MKVESIFGGSNSQTSVKKLWIKFVTLGVSNCRTCLSFWCMHESSWKLKLWKWIHLCIPILTETRAKSDDENPSSTILPMPIFNLKPLLSAFSFQQIFRVRGSDLCRIEGLMDPNFDIHIPAALPNANRNDRHFNWTRLRILGINPSSRNIIPRFHDFRLTVLLILTNRSCSFQKQRTIYLLKAGSIPQDWNENYSIISRCLAGSCWQTFEDIFKNWEKIPQK